MDNDTKGLQKIRLAVTHRKPEKVISEKEKVTPPQKEKETPPQKEIITKEPPKEKKVIDRQAEIKKVRRGNPSWLKRTGAEQTDHRETKECGRRWKEEVKLRRDVD